jgi:hypothetical protein
MFCFKEAADVVGEAKRIEKVESAVALLKAVWDSRQQKRSFRLSTSGMSSVTNFLLLSLDMLVKVVDEAVLIGPDKKATVLDAVDRLYDYTVKEALPIWLIPVAGPIKAYVIHILVSSAIDWVVSKYRDGSWRTDEQNQSSEKKEARRAK